MKHFYTAFCFLCLAVMASAQVERKLPLNGNPQLSVQGVQVGKSVAKTGITLPKQLPLVENFDYNKPDTLFWLDSNVTANNSVGVFNAQDATGSTYSNADNSFGETDVLTGKAVNLTGMPERFYMSVSYATGSTWQVGDSLVIQAKNAAGFWDNVWSAKPITALTRTETFDFPLGLLYQHATFQLRVLCYANRSVANTNNFNLTQLVFALKPTLPYYENVFWNSIQNYRNDWSLMQGEQRVDTTIGWGKVIKLDAFDATSTPYNNGFFDTIQSHAFDLSKFVSTDSVFFRVYYKSVINTNTDSLLVQLKNNGGSWVNVFAVSAANASNWNVFSVNVNRNRFNHSSFQYRIIARGSTNDTAKWYVSGLNIGKKLVLPFVDDFSASAVYPDQTKWMDKAVFVNNRFSINPPSKNVATFDGLTAYGQPYGTGRGYCDSLTSFPIKLNGFTAADSVYLSFYVQPQGLGMEPDLGDTLSLFARYSAQSPDSFNLLWRAAPGAFSIDSFLQVRIALPAQYLHEEFQIRFINKGSRTGNLSHWHLDYVYLNKGRNASDAITDIAIQNDPSPLLKKFSSIPYAHFKSAATTYTLDTQYFSIKNNSNVSYAIDYGREVYDQNFARIDSFGSIISIMPAFQTRSANIKKTINLNGSFTTDSMWVWSRYYTRLGATADNIPSNDTTWQGTFFGNYYAYDDGTAEAGYAIENSPGKVALRYPLIKGDSLYGMCIYFNRGKQDVSSQSFNLMVWKRIDLTSEEVLLRIPAAAVYYNERNLFYYVKFSQPIYVENEVYIGWEQNSIFPLNVGLDLNFKVNEQYAPNPEMYYNVQNLWQSTQLNGALMMRPIFGKWVDPVVGVNEPLKNEWRVQVYPNPTSGMVQIVTPNHHNMQVTVFDLAGRALIQQKNVDQQIDLSELKNGMYVLQLHDLVTGSYHTQKVLVQHD